jgi:WD40 repeat protein
VAFSPDGKRIVSGSRDKTVKVWDAERGQEVLTLKGHTDAGSAQYRDMILKDARSLGMHARSVEARDEDELTAAILGGVL